MSRHPLRRWSLCIISILYCAAAPSPLVPSNGISSWALLAAGRQMRELRERASVHKGERMTPALLLAQGGGNLSSYMHPPHGFWSLPAHKLGCCEG